MNENNKNPNETKLAQNNNLIDEKKENIENAPDQNNEIKITQNNNDNSKEENNNKKYDNIDKLNDEHYLDIIKEKLKEMNIIIMIIKKQILVNI